MGSLALLPLGYVLSGWLGRLVGDARLLQIGGAIGTVALVLALLPRSTRELRRLDDAAPRDESVTAALAADASRP